MTFYKLRSETWTAQSTLVTGGRSQARSCPSRLCYLSTWGTRGNGVGDDQPEATESGIFLLERQDDLQLISSVLKPLRNEGTTQLPRQSDAHGRDRAANTLLKSQSIGGGIGLRACFYFLLHRSLTIQTILLRKTRRGRGHLQKGLYPRESSIWRKSRSPRAQFNRFS